MWLVPGLMWQRRLVQDRDPRDERIAHLERALVTRSVIGQAMGILMERYGINADTAFRTLVRVGTDEKRKVHLVAEHLIATGELGEAPSEAAQAGFRRLEGGFALRRENADGQDPGA